MLGSRPCACVKAMHSSERWTGVESYLPCEGTATIRRLSVGNAILVILCIILTCLADVCGGSVPAADSSIAFVGQGQASGRTLREALQDPGVSTIVLASDYVVGSEFDTLSTPIALNRNVTLYGLPGIWPLLDFGNQPPSTGVVQLCSTCVFKVVNVSTNGESHRGKLRTINFFKGEQGSRVILQNGYRLRLVCSTINSTVAALSTTPRSLVFPLPPSGQQQQQLLLPTAGKTFQSKQYPEAVLLEDVAYDVPVSLGAGGKYVGGYAVHLINRTVLCAHHVADSCLAIRSPEECIAQMTDELLGLPTAVGVARGMSPGTLAGIAVPVAVLGIALLAVAVWLVAHHRRRRLLMQQLPPVGKSELGRPGGASSTGEVTKRDEECAVSGSRPASNGSGVFGPARNGSGGSEAPGPAHAVCRMGSGDGQGVSSSRDNLADTSEVQVVIDPSGPPEADIVHKPLALGLKGWEVVGSQTTPTMKHAANCKIQLGELLGAGSFARVFKGTWAGMDVAVKVIEHDSQATEVVQNEVQLMLDLNHPNVIRAYHYVSYMYTQNKNNNISNTTNSSAVSSAANAVRAREQMQAAAAANARDPQTFAPTGFVGNQLSLAGQLCRYQVPQTELGELLLPTLNQQQPAVAGMPPPLQRGTSITVPETPDCRTPGAVGVSDLLLSTSLFSGGDTAETASFTKPGQPTATGSPTAEPDGSMVVKDVSPAAAATNSFNTSTTGTSGWTSDGKGPGGSKAWAVMSGSPLSFRPPFKPSAHILRGETMLVLEYADCGTLSSVAAQCWSPDHEDDAQMLQRLLLLQDCARGLELLHSRCIVHGDLNAQNVLVCSTNRSECGLTAKLGDLGLSRVIKSSTHRTTRTVGTMSHMPPCLLQYGRCSPAMDVYSFGIMMWELYTGQVAFQQLHYGQFFETVVLRSKRPEVPPDMPDDYQLLMEHCWTQEPSERPNVTQVLECLELMIQDRRDSLRMAGAAGAAAQMQPGSSSEPEPSPRCAGSPPHLVAQEPQEGVTQPLDQQ